MSTQYFLMRIKTHANVSVFGCSSMVDSFFCCDSLSVFIVSDTESLSEGEDSCHGDENLPPHTSSPTKRSSIYFNPCTTNSGIVFWGSPELSPPRLAKNPLTPANRPPLLHPATTVGRRGVPSTPLSRPPRPHPVTVAGKRSVPQTARPPPAVTAKGRDVPSTPLNRLQRPHPVTTAGRRGFPLTPANHPPLQLPVTTPSAGRSFSRSKDKMVAELFKLFNDSVFDGMVSEHANHGEHVCTAVCLGSKFNQLFL